MTTITIDLPPTFYEDHIGRDLPGGTVVKYLSGAVRVSLDEEAYAELLSDARAYSDHKDWEREYWGVCTSANATVKRLLAAETPWDKPTVRTPAPVDPAEQEARREAARAEAQAKSDAKQARRFGREMVETGSLKVLMKIQAAVQAAGYEAATETKGTRPQLRIWTRDEVAAVNRIVEEAIG